MSDTMSKTAAAAAASREATARAVAMFADGTDVVAIAAELGLSVKSVAARLSRAGVYHASRPVGKRAGVKKTDIVSAMVASAPTLANHADDLERLTRATLTALMAVVK
jgi:hypothetical protein